jgi:hypothetical protein
LHIVPRIPMESLHPSTLAPTVGEDCVVFESPRGNLFDQRFVKARGWIPGADELVTRFHMACVCFIGTTTRHSPRSKHHIGSREFENQTKERINFHDKRHGPQIPDPCLCSGRQLVSGRFKRMHYSNLVGCSAVRFVSLTCSTSR